MKQILSTVAAAALVTGAFGVVDAHADGTRFVFRGPMSKVRLISLAATAPSGGEEAMGGSGSGDGGDEASGGDDAGDTGGEPAQVSPNRWLTVAFTSGAKATCPLNADTPAPVSDAAAEAWAAALIGKSWTYVKIFSSTAWTIYAPEVDPKGLWVSTHLTVDGVPYTGDFAGFSFYGDNNGFNMSGAQACAHDYSAPDDLAKNGHWIDAGGDPYYYRDVYAGSMHRPLTITAATIEYH